MEESRVIRYLTDFGLSRQEALVYEQLLAGGKQTGYEIARDTGISRSNAYTSLAGLVEKGAAYLVEETAKKYIPVCPEEFCGNRIRRMEEEKRWLSVNLACEKTEEEGYITIEGEEHIRDKIQNLMEKAEERVYLSCSRACLDGLGNELGMLVKEGRNHRRALSLAGSACVCDRRKRVPDRTDHRFQIRAVGRIRTGKYEYMSLLWTEKLCHVV